MTRTELASQLRALRAKATQGECYVNNQEFDSRLMLKNGSFFGEFEQPSNADFTAFAFNQADTIAAALEEAERENRELRDALLAITIEGDGTNEHRIASEALSPTTTALDEGKTHTPKGGDALCSNDE
jgi:hypothetical protein